MTGRNLDSEHPGSSGRVGGRQDVGVAKVEWVDAGGALSSAESSYVERAATRAAAELGVSGEVRVRIVRDAEMATAHERYSGVAGTTDVLTFDLRDAGERATSPMAMDVDILVCVDEARRAAKLRGHHVEQELALYIVHGLLHCLGHDDHDESAYERMHAAEDRVLEMIGVGRVFGGPAREEGVN